MTDVLEKMARAIEDASFGSEPMAIPRAALRVALEDMREHLQDELEQLYLRQAESMSLAPNSYGHGYDSGKVNAVEDAIESLSQYAKENLDE